MRPELLPRLCTRIFLLLACAGLSCAGLAGCGGEKKKAAAGAAQQGGRGQAVAVRTAEAELRGETFYTTYPGTVVALEQVEIRPQVAGYITEVHFKPGDRVKRGQRLYSVDAGSYQTGVSQADASISTAEANLALAEKNVERYRRLAASEAIATQTLEQAEAQAEVYRQQLASSKAQLAGAETQFDYTSITSPIDGSTGLASVQVGTQVSPGQPLLATVSQLAPIGVDFALEQDEIDRFAELEGRSLKRLDSTFRLELSGGAPYPEFGKIYALDRAVDPRTGSLTIRLQFANANMQLRSGMNADVEVLNSSSGEVVLIPNAAIGEQMGEFYVFEVVDSLALRHPITTGQQIRGRTVVTNGLKGGERVVIAGLKSLRDSSRVTIAPPPDTGAVAARPTAKSTQAN